MSDGDLVRRVRNGEAEALAELMNRWAPRALALCHVYANRQAAADLAQDSLLRAISHFSQLRDPEQFGSWLRGIIKRVCYDWIDSKKRTMVPFSALTVDKWNRPADARGERDQELAQTLSEELLAAVNELPLEYREVLHLYYSSKLTYLELASILEVSAATVNARLTRGRAMLREKLMLRMETTS